MSKEQQFKTMDGNTAAAHVSYAFTEVAGIYPITPSSPMADCVDQWATEGRKNIFGGTVKVMEMQSEAGAAGTVHGSLNTGALTTTYTASQGLLLMIPNMYKIAGELLPAVFHVSARAVASHALSIFGDHSDIYACRQTGFAMLCENNPQEVMDLSPVAHLAALKGSVPFVNFFDGFRTSHEIQKLRVWDYDDLAEMVDWDSVQRFKDRALNPDRPQMRGSHENGDIFFQNREASNSYYEAIPAIVEDYMAQINARLGTDYQLFNYYGAPDAERVIIAMGSVCDTAAEVVDYLAARGEKVGLVKVHLFRPFAADRLLEAVPKTATHIAVLDRTKEPGSQGEPLYMDVVAAFSRAGRSAVICGGRYGLGSKDTPPRSLHAVYEELKKDSPKPIFTLSIVDDVTGLSLDEPDIPDTAPAGTIQCKFWGLGGDGTVGANKNSIKIIGDHTDKYVQAYFQYDSKKTGGVTISHLRFGDQPIRCPYYITKADFVACHNPAYIIKGFHMVEDVKPGGIFLINCSWDAAALEQNLNGEAKRYIARNNIQLYTIDAINLAMQIGMGKRTNTILQSAFFVLAGILPKQDALQYMKDAATHSYMKKGADIVELNHKAIDAGADALVKIDVPAAWADAPDAAAAAHISSENQRLAEQVESITVPVERMDGDRLPVSAFVKHADGTYEVGASAFSKAGVSAFVPTWSGEKCAQCNRCAYVCSHATIRPFALTEAEAAAAPEAAKLFPTKAGKGKGVYSYTISISPLDCMGCGVCADVCPTGCLQMSPAEEQAPQQEVWNYMVSSVAEKPELQDNTVKGSQFRRPLLQFSGSCAGCAETAYARLVTQLFGERMYVANATGCSSIWGGTAGCSPYATATNGRGVAWANSLFEDNAEYGLGMLLGQKAVRDRLIDSTKELLECEGANNAEFRAAAENYLATVDDGATNTAAADALVAALEKLPESALKQKLLDNKAYLSKKSVWIFGGDGWAYDIGFGGVDHVAASGMDVNIFVFDTEVYSNTGGQASKASNFGQVAQFAAAGKNTAKKSLSEILMSYGYVYVAQVAMGADMNQTLKAITEAEAYPGPSVIIGYSPCEMHSIKGGMKNCQSEMKWAVDCGYWNLFRYNPANPEKPFSLDSKAPGTKEDYVSFLMNEARYSALARFFPERADGLFDKSAVAAMKRYAQLERLRDYYNEGK
ncbi:MAG: pyruvate:ferredoxin (flavodoxin) oxidoreductase [Oscillospiraceae bacterium]|nr:pyruvate:ferredoxin (flavodoxin) oxidoreductase [Oscillospiraceae bacterium]